MTASNSAGIADCAGGVARCARHMGHQDGHDFVSVEGTAPEHLIGDAAQSVQVREMGDTAEVADLSGAMY